MGDNLGKSDGDSAAPEKTKTPRKTLAQRLGTAGVLGATVFAAFLLWLLIGIVFQPTEADRYALLKAIHFWVSRAGLTAAGVMLSLSVYIGLIQHSDVTPWFRMTTYTIVAFIMAQGAIGGIMWLLGGRSGEEVHVIYGYAAVLSLPFFIFVEVTARKRPAMGSYIWGFALLLGILARSIMTGPVR